MPLQCTRSPLGHPCMGGWHRWDDMDGWHRWDDMVRCISEMAWVKRVHMVCHELPRCHLLGYLSNVAQKRVPKSHVWVLCPKSTQITDQIYVFGSGIFWNDHVNERLAWPTARPPRECNLIAHLGNERMIKNWKLIPTPAAHEGTSHPPIVCNWKLDKFQMKFQNWLDDLIDCPFVPHWTMRNGVCPSTMMFFTFVCVNVWKNFYGSSSNRKKALLVENLFLTSRLHFQWWHFLCTSLGVGFRSHQGHR